MTSKNFDLPFGERGKTDPDPAAESVRQAQALKQKKDIKREDELDDVQHTAKVAEAEAKAAEAKKKAEEAGGGGSKSEITFKPVEVDIQSGEKAAEERAREAKEEARLSREAAARATEALAAERTKGLENKISELGVKIQETIQSGGDKKTLGDQISEFEKTAVELGFAKGGTTTVSPEIQVQLTQMNNDLQLRLEVMKDERDRRDKDWQLTLKKWEDEKAFRREELAQKAEIENQRMSFLTQAQERIGRVIAQTVKGGGGGGGGFAEEQAGKSFHIEAGEGEEGETSCPKCGSSIFIASDAKGVMCDKCGLDVEVRRQAPAEAKKRKEEKASE